MAEWRSLRFLSVRCEWFWSVSTVASVIQSISIRPPLFRMGHSPSSYEYISLSASIQQNFTQSHPRENTATISIKTRWWEIGADSICRGSVVVFRVCSWCGCRQLTCEGHVKLPKCPTGWKGEWRVTHLTTTQHETAWQSTAQPALNPTKPIQNNSITSQKQSRSVPKSTEHCF